MAQTRRAWVLLLLGLLRLGSCAIFSSVRQALQFMRDQAGRQNAPLRQSSYAWVKIGLFELPTAEDLKEEMLGFDSSSGKEASSSDGKGAGDDASKTAESSNTSSTPTSRMFLHAMHLEWVSRELGKVADGGGAILQTGAALSLDLGKKGCLWLQERWRAKLVYCALAVYGVRVAGRVVAGISAGLKNAGSSDVLLDTDDKVLGSRGAILDVEGLVLLLKLSALGDPPAAAPARLVSAGVETREGDGSTTAEEKNCGWGTLEREIRRAIGLRYAGGRRGVYAEELAQALKDLEDARGNADFEVLGPQRSSFVEQAVLLIQARLCDACLRLLRDGLIRAASGLSTLCAFWKDQKSNHRRMGVFKSILLGRFHGKVFGKRATLEKDQEKISACELLLERHLRRLGAVQSHLQARPRVSMESTTPTSGGMFTETATRSLEAWMDVGVAIFLRELDELEDLNPTLRTVSDARVLGDTAFGGGVRCGALHSSGVSDGVAVTMLRAGWNCRSDDSDRDRSNSDCGGGTQSSLSVNGKTPGRAFRGAPPGSAVSVLTFGGTVRGRTVPQESDLGSGVLAVILLRSKPESNPTASSPQDRALSPDAQPKVRARSGVEVEQNKAIGKDVGSGRIPGLGGAAGRSSQPIGEVKSKEFLVSGLRTWLTAPKPSELHQLQRRVIAGPPAAKVERRVNISSSKKAIGQTSAVSSSRREKVGDSNTGEAGVEGGGWKVRITSANSGKAKREGSGVEARPVMKEKHSCTPEENEDSSAVLPKSIRWKARDAAVVEAKDESFRRAKRFSIDNTSKQEAASGGGSKRLTSKIAKAGDAIPVSKNEKGRAGVRAREDAEVKLVAGGKGRNLRIDLLSGWQWKKWASPVVAVVSAAGKSGRNMNFPRFRLGRSGSIDESEGIIRDAIGDKASVKAKTVATALAAVVAAAAVRTFLADTSSPFVETGSAGSSPDKIYGAQEDGKNMDSFDERVGTRIPRQEETSRFFAENNGSDSSRSPARGATTGYEFVEAAAYTGGLADAKSDAPGSPTYINDRDATTINGTDDLALKMTCSSRRRRPGRISQGCARLCGSLVGGVLFCHRGVTAVAGVARVAGVRGARKLAKFGVICASFVLASPVKLAVAGSLATRRACAAAGGAAVATTASFKCRCARVGRSAGSMASAGCVTATAVTCLAGSVVFKEVIKAGKVCAGGAGAVLSTTGQLAQAVIIPRQVVDKFIRRPLVRLRGWVAGLIAVGYLTALSTTRFAGKTAAHGSIKTAQFCASVPVSAFFITTRAARVPLYFVKIATPRPGKASRRATNHDTESTLSVGGRGKSPPYATIGVPGVFSINDTYINLKHYGGGDVALADVVIGNSVVVSNISAGSEEVSTLGYESTLSRELGDATGVNEKYKIERPPPLPAVHLPWRELPQKSLKLKNGVDALESQATASSKNEPSSSMVSPRKKKLIQLSSAAPSLGVTEHSAQRSHLLVEGVARSARIASPSGGNSATGLGGVRTIGVARALCARAAGEAAALDCARPVTNKVVRSAAGLILSTPAAVRMGRYARHNWKDFRRIQLEAAAGLSTFFSEQLWEPCQAIVKQVLFRERQSFLMDEAAFEDAEASLRNMLRDFVSDKKNKVPEELRERAIAAMDMSVVSRQLEKETRGAIRGTVSGKIPRMLLIQTTFLKKELLHAMAGIDDLYQANQVTLRLISIVPAALVIVGAYKVTTVLLLAAFSRRLEPTILVHRSMRALVREMERMLTSSRGFDGGEGEERAAVGGRGVLDHEETGRLALFLHTLQTILRQNSSRFEARARRGLEDDLSDMSRGRTTVPQQMEIVRRMQRSYPFLRPEGG